MYVAAGWTAGCPTQHAEVWVSPDYSCNFLASFPRPTTGNEASNFYRLRSSNVSMDCPFLDPKSGADFKLDQFLAAPCETFDPHYGKQVAITLFHGVHVHHSIQPMYCLQVLVAMMAMVTLQSLRILMHSGSMYWSTQIAGGCTVSWQMV